MSFLYLIFSPFHYFLSRCFLITFLNVFPFGVTFNFFLTDFEHCNDPGAQGRSFSYTFGKECDIRNLRVSENRKTRLLQFNGILFKSSLSCSKQDRGLFPSWDKSITEYTSEGTSYLWVVFYIASFVQLIEFRHYYNIQLKVW